MSATAQLTEEIEKIVRRYAQESDITVAEALGVLEFVKMNLLRGTTDGETEEVHE